MNQTDLGLRFRENWTNSLDKSIQIISSSDENIFFFYIYAQFFFKLITSPLFSQIPVTYYGFP